MEWAYLLLVLSSGIYCGLDEYIQENAALKYNGTAISHGSRECNVHQCVLKSLRLYEDGKLVESGWITLTGVFSGFNSTTIAKTKKMINSCFTEAEQKGSGYPKCTKYVAVLENLKICAERNALKFT